jgi:hypothetical protein
MATERKDALAALRNIAFVLIASLSLLWPAMVNGGPFWHPDTTNYIRAADGATAFAFGVRTEWSDRLANPAPAATSETSPLIEQATSSVQSVVPTRPVLLGRSVFYGFMIYLPMLAFGLWGAIITQALVAGATTAYCASLIIHKEQRSTWMLLPLLAAVTPMGYYACMLMPDIYSGLQILVLATMIVTWTTIKLRDKIRLMALAALFITFHTTNLLMTICVLTAAVIFALSANRNRLRPAIIGAFLIAIALGANLAFSYSIQLATGSMPYSPPFLTARLQDQGPGLAYINNNCDKSDDATFLICDYRDKLPLPSDSFLWSENPATGVFQLLTADERLRMASEDRRFYLSVMSDSPVAFARSSIGWSIEQLGDFGLSNFNYGHRVGGMEAKYPPSIAPKVRSSAAARNSMPTEPIVTFSIIVSLLSLAGIAALFLSGQLKAGEPALSCRRGAMLIVLGVLANAVICGALSGPHERYQMRLIWLVPFAALIAAAGTGRQKADAQQVAVSNR